MLARALLIVGASGLFMAGAGAALASAGLGDSAGPGDTAPSMSWDNTKALEIDATPGASVSATLLNNTAAALDVRMQVDAPDEIAVTAAQLSIPAGWTKAIRAERHSRAQDRLFARSDPTVMPLTQLFIANDRPSRHSPDAVVSADLPASLPDPNTARTFSEASPGSLTINGR